MIYIYLISLGVILLSSLFAILYERIYLTRWQKFRFWGMAWLCAAGLADNQFYQFRPLFVTVFFSVSACLFVGHVIEMWRINHAIK